MQGSRHKHIRVFSAAQAAGPGCPGGCNPLGFSVTSEALLLALPGSTEPLPGPGRRFSGASSFAHAGAQAASA